MPGLAHCCGSLIPVSRSIFRINAQLYVTPDSGLTGSECPLISRVLVTITKKQKTRNKKNPQTNKHLPPDVTLLFLYMFCMFMVLFSVVCVVSFFLQVKSAKLCGFNPKRPQSDILQPMIVQGDLGSNPSFLSGPLSPAANDL